MIMPQTASFCCVLYNGINILNMSCPLIGRPGDDLLKKLFATEVAPKLFTNLNFVSLRSILLTVRWLKTWGNNQAVQQLEIHV